MSVIKYRKKPVIVEAVQFKRDNFEEVKAFTNNAAHSLTIERRLDGKAYCRVRSMGGEFTVNENDYILKTSSGDCFTLRPDIFAKTYEEVL